MDLGAPPAYEVQVPPQFHGGRVIPYVATWPPDQGRWLAQDGDGKLMRFLVPEGLKPGDVFTVSQPSLVVTPGKKNLNGVYA